jgi:hypothetical protein
MAVAAANSFTGTGRELHKLCNQRTACLLGFSADRDLPGDTATPGAEFHPSLLPGRWFDDRGSPADAKNDAKEIQNLHRPSGRAVS